MSIRRSLLVLVAVATMLTSIFIPGACLAQPAAASRGANQQFAAAAGLHNQQAFDLAADEWAKFLKDYPDDKRVSEARHYLGICLMQKQDYAGAATVLGQLLAADPKFEKAPSSQLYLGLAQFNLGRAGKADRYPAAEKTLAELLAKHPEGTHAAQAWYYRGEAEYAQGKKAEAVKSYRQFVADHADDALFPDALYALGVALDETGKRKEAAALYDDFLKRFPQHDLTTDVGVRQAELLAADGKLVEAEKLFAKAAADKAYEAGDYALLRQAGSVYDRQQFAAARELYDALPQRFPQSQFLGAAALSSGKSAYFAGDYPGTVSRLSKLAKTADEAGVEAAHWTARASLKLGKPAEALALAESAAKAAAKTKFAAQLELDRADALYEIADRRKDALTAYRDLAKNHAGDPLAAQAWYLAAFTALELGDNEDAGNLANSFLKAHQGHALDSAVRYVGAEATLRDGKYTDAATRYDALLKDAGDHADRSLWTVRRAVALSLAEKHDEVIKSLGKTADQLGGKALTAEARHLLGLSRQAQQDYKGAIADFQASLAADPERKAADETLLALAETQRLSGDAAGAKATLAKFAATYPKSLLLDTAEYRTAELASAAGDAKTAEAAYRRVIDNFPQSRLAPHARHGLAWSLFHRGEAAEAVKAADPLVAAIKPETQQVKIDPPVATTRKSRGKINEVPVSNAVAGAIDVEVQGLYIRALAKHRLKQYQPALDDLEAFLRTRSQGADRADAMYVRGLCQEALDKNDEAANSFTTLLRENPQYPGAAKAMYELGWVYKSLNKPDESAATFAKLAKDFPADPLAAEALFHVGEAAYEKKDYKAAYYAYFDAREKAGSAELAEKAAHKAGWASFHQEDYKKAEEFFIFQQKQYGKGPLAEDAAFMEGESAFKQQKYKEALAAYGRVKEPKGPDFLVLALLHGGQAAAQLNDFKQSRTMLDAAAGQFPNSPYLPEINYERAWALQNLGQDEDALKLYETVTTQTDREIAARSRFMIGEIHFTKKNHAEAVRHFFKAAYGYDYPEWKARAHFEAGRCFEVLGKLPQAKQSYQEVAEKYPQFEEAGLAKKRLAELGS